MATFDELKDAFLKHSQPSKAALITHYKSLIACAKEHGVKLPERLNLKAANKGRICAAAHALVAIIEGSQPGKTCNAL